MGLIKIYRKRGVKNFPVQKEEPKKSTLVSTKREIYRAERTLNPVQLPSNSKFFSKYKYGPCEKQSSLASKEKIDEFEKEYLAFIEMLKKKLEEEDKEQTM